MGELMNKAHVITEMSVSALYEWETRRSLWDKHKAADEDIYHYGKAKSKSSEKNG